MKEVERGKVRGDLGPVLPYKDKDFK